MQAVILAAGNSTRTYPLTTTRPKSMLKVANKEIIFHTLDALSEFVSEFIIVVGYKKEMIISLLGNEYKGIPIRYAEQKEQLGTGNALGTAKELIRGRFLVLMGDDLYDREDIRRLCAQDGLTILASEVKNPQEFGVIIEEEGFLKGILEKPKQPPSNLANCGCYILNERIFNEEERMSERGELELTQMVTQLSLKERVKIVKASNWTPITYPWSIIEANEKALSSLKGKIEGTVEPGATLKGEVHVGRGSIVKSGAYIEGPVLIGENCRIGPNCYIRASTTIGNNCHIGNAVEIKNSVIFDNTNVAHLSYIGDSVLGYNVNIGAGNITANLRHDNGNIKSMVKGILIDTGRRKFGTIIGDNVHTGINTSIYPGRKIWNDKTTLPGEIVKEDIM
ncbi:MAG: sugar phosphate nucleotidyltransferase [Candidatus Woesearchaeota archaeon]